MREFLYKALISPFGIALHTDDVQGLIQKLSIERRKSGDPALKAIVIAVSRSDPASEVWLIKRPEESNGKEE